MVDILAILESTTRLFFSYYCVHFVMVCTSKKSRSAFTLMWQACVQGGWSFIYVRLIQCTCLAAHIGQRKRQRQYWSRNVTRHSCQRQSQWLVQKGTWQQICFPDAHAQMSHTGVYVCPPQPQLCSTFRLAAPRSRRPGTTWSPTVAMVLRASHTTITFPT